MRTAFCYLNVDNGRNAHSLPDCASGGSAGTELVVDVRQVETVHDRLIVTNVNEQTCKTRSQVRRQL